MPLSTTEKSILEKGISLLVSYLKSFSFCPLHVHGDVPHTGQWQSDLTFSHASITFEDAAFSTGTWFLIPSVAPAIFPIALLRIWIEFPKYLTNAAVESVASVREDVVPAVISCFLGNDLSYASEKSDLKSSVADSERAS